jgi:hypothetical protein
MQSIVLRLRPLLLVPLMRKLAPPQATHVPYRNVVP